LKKKLTITVDSEVLPLAKQYARSQGVSLSSLIEQSLREMAKQDGPSFSSRWRGEFREARIEDARYRALAKKFL
jgi:post-segregation antitoxin (ccd killing protein)